MKYRGVIETYRKFLPVTAETKIVTLQEGNTPLIHVPRFVREIGGEFDLYLKYEGLNPTGSFKDRGMTMAMTMAYTRGAEIVICASTGNTSAAAAAYAARVGLRCVVLLPAGKIAMGKLAQALIYGAEVIAVRGNFDDALKIVRELGNRPEIEIVNSINPYRFHGQKTASFEICDFLDRSPDYHFTPVGNAGNITAYWMGFKEYQQAGKVSTLPRMMGWQAAGAAPMVSGQVVPNPETIATAIRIGNPAAWQVALTALKESNGQVGKVTDEQILQAQQLLARTEGVFVEPASAAPLAGLMTMVKEIPAGSVITATMTGHGLKDPDVVIKAFEGRLREVDATSQAVAKLMKL